MPPEEESRPAVDRRSFLCELARSGLYAWLSGTLAHDLLGREAAPPLLSNGLRPYPASYWYRLPGGADVQCELCPRNERLAPGQTGYCRGRQNLDGRLVTYGYHAPCVLATDPIEKNPLNHVLPGSEVLSIAFAGCNITCLYCQNWQYSQQGPAGTKNIHDFERDSALAKATGKNMKGVAFTYTEPLIYPEFIIATAERAVKMGLSPTLCTCGFANPKPFKDLIKPFKAVTITYKGPTERFYKDICHASLRPVLEAMKIVRQEGKWLEVATLVVPTLNDDEDSIRTMSRWIAAELGKDIPWHLERFQPQYKLERLPQTPQATLEKARSIGLAEGLRFVYISNLAPHEGNHTYCPGCGNAVIRRLGFKVTQNSLSSGRCSECRREIPGIW